MTDSTTEPIVSWAVGFLTGGFFGFRSGWLWGRGGAVRRTPFIFNEGHTTRTNSGPGPTTPKPDIVPKPQYPGGHISLDGAQPFRVRGRLQPLPDELDAYTDQRGPQDDTPNPPPEAP